MDTDDYEYARIHLSNRGVYQWEITKVSSQRKAVREWATLCVCVLHPFLLRLYGGSSFASSYITVSIREPSPCVCGYSHVFLHSLSLGVFKHLLL